MEHLIFYGNFFSFSSAARLKLSPATLLTRLHLNLETHLTKITRKEEHLILPENSRDRPSEFRRRRSPSRRRRGCRRWVWGFMGNRVGIPETDPS
ncbi:hypothetical protein M5689_003681 [Euphorbia peplus]|nr:hypothetical protein M5689_003681 [Euphorbia peplus]